MARLSLAQWGNDLYSGKRSIRVIGRSRLWFAIAAGVVLFSLGILLFKGLNPGIEFRGGSEFRISGVQTSELGPAEDVVKEEVPDAAEPIVSAIGTNSIRVQTERLSDDQTDALRGSLAQAYEVEPGAVTSSFVGATWGQDVTRKALTSLAVFLVLVSVVIAAYFRAWQFAVAALVALLHDLAATVGIYALIGFEVTPATVIGFLTILGYSLYDTVVVFDKVRENTAHIATSTKRTYAEATNLAVNQTMVRSINTSVVALLPVAAILFIGAYLLGAGTLKDISLALLIGIAAGTYSSIFLAPVVLVWLKQREGAIRDQEERVDRARTVAARRREEAGADDADLVLAGAGAGEGSARAGSGSATGVRSAPAAVGGPRNQPKRGRKQRPSGKRK